MLAANAADAAYVDLEAMERYECDPDPMMVPVVDSLIAIAVFGATSWLHEEEEEEGMDAKMQAMDDMFGVIEDMLDMLAAQEEEEEEREHYVCEPDPVLDPMVNELIAKTVSVATSWMEEDEVVTWFGGWL